MLVERVLQLITDRDNPLEIDRLLVVTFTNAAAAGDEAAHRCGPGESHQGKPSLYSPAPPALLLNSVHISTVHSLLPGDDQAVVLPAGP